MKKNTYCLFGISALAITKFRLTLFVVFMLVASSSIGFAIWEETSPLNDDQRIIIGEGTSFEVIRISDPPEENMRLVPLGAFLGHDEIDYYSYHYEVAINKNAQLSVYAQNIEIGNTSDLSDLVVFEYALNEDFINATLQPLQVNIGDSYYDDTEELYLINVYIKVILQEPTNQAQYLAMAKKPLVFELVFEINELTEED